jgi:multisubunit Na+/H+ antiporter MnhF subunit
LGIKLPDVVMRLLFAGGAGLIPVLATASGYDPQASPIAQQVRQGLGRIISTTTRLMLPLALLVLVVYLVVIPFNLLEPYRNRETLIVYNVMLFAVMGLLVGATPVREMDLATRHHRTLRVGILAVALLATLVSLYALSATVYRTVLGGFTVNRLTVIGWNGINIAILVLLVTKQLRVGAERWLDALQRVFAWGMTAYAVWAIFLVLVIPLLFSER